MKSSSRVSSTARAGLQEVKLKNVIPLLTRGRGCTAACEPQNLGKAIPVGVVGVVFEGGEFLAIAVHELHGTLGQAILNNLPTAKIYGIFKAWLLQVRSLEADRKAFTLPSRKVVRSRALVLAYRCSPILPTNEPRVGLDAWDDHRRRLHMPWALKPFERSALRLLESTPAAIYVDEVNFNCPLHDVSLRART